MVFAIISQWRGSRFNSWEETFTVMKHLQRTMKKIGSNAGWEFGKINGDGNFNVLTTHYLTNSRYWLSMGHCVTEFSDADGPLSVFCYNCNYNYISFSFLFNNVPSSFHSDQVLWRVPKQCVVQDFFLYLVEYRGTQFELIEVQCGWF